MCRDALAMDLQGYITDLREKFSGADDRNRTCAHDLEGRCSAAELRPPYYGS